MPGRLRVKRGKDKLTLRQAAEESGIHAATLSRIERGQNFDVTTLRLLCEWLGDGPSELLGWRSD